MGHMAPWTARSAAPGRRWADGLKYLNSTLASGRRTAGSCRSHQNYRELWGLNDRLVFANWRACCQYLARRPTAAWRRDVPSRVAMWPMRSFAVNFREVQKSSARLTVSSDGTHALVSKVHGKRQHLVQVAPMSRYQSCSPGMNFLDCYSSTGRRPAATRPVAQLREVAAEDQNPPADHRLYFLNGTRLSTKRLFTSFG